MNRLQKDARVALSKAQVADGGFLTEATAQINLVVARDDTTLWVEELHEAIFNGLPQGRKAWWHVSFAEALPVDADFVPEYHKVAAAILGFALRSRNRWHSFWGDECAAVIVRARDLHLARQPPTVICVPPRYDPLLVFRPSWAKEYTVTDLGVAAKRASQGARVVFYRRGVERGLLSRIFGVNRPDFGALSAGEAALSAMFSVEGAGSLHHHRVSHELMNLAFSVDVNQSIRR
jgi:hypothetical protein